ncbi:tRNA pseudouridine(65) synthase TruC [Alteromonas sediminis]|uniref:tRNA pseudouridine synthase C n=1 Tax=Alteromonas sediminis TaxID=2259342 RepID=A0A3N5YA68_9ALTE|nr:pseudouridine synthase [Alteromonas sediminis]RPJ68359.1 tRNA pseudouridine(65) synthase TruC [Alteromonas sediminis]
MNNQPLSILYQDDCVIAINKPSGLLVHRSPLDKRAQHFAVQQLRDQVGRHVYPVHRLDRPTSGVLLFAFSPDTVALLQKNWDRGVQKRYQALVRGWVKGAGIIDYPLRYEPDKIAEKHKREDNVQQAMSYYQSIQHYQAPYPVGRYKTGRYSLVELGLYTGRKHQLRRHMAHIRHPIVGDTTHGDGKQNAFMRAQFGCEHLALSCISIQFVHPKTGRTVMVSSPRSENFESCLTQLAQFSL